VNRSRWGYPLALFAATFAVLLTWTVATPLFASPDEPAHLYKAYGTAHGQAIGEPMEETLSNIRTFDVPEVMGQPPNIMCFIFQANVTAGCVQPGAVGAGISTAAVYPPFWYGLVGGGARIVGGDTSQRTYRAIGGVLCAALIAAAFAVARRAPSGRLSPLLLIGLTPMTLFLSGSVNPTGFEIAGFVLLWAVCLHLDSRSAATRRGGVIVGSIVAAVMLAHFASVMWVITGAVVMALVLGIAGLRPFLRRSFLLPAAGIAAAATVALFAWSRYAGAEAEDPRLATDMTLVDAAQESWRRLPDFAQQMIGVLGWLDTELPWFVYAGFIAFAVIISIGILRSGDTRLMLAGGAILSGLVGIPILVNTASAGSAGLIWQGRYQLPLFAMLGLVGMLAWQRVVDRSADQRTLAAIRWGSCSLFAFAEIAAFWQSLRRFSVGANGKIWLTEPLGYSPSIAPMLLIALNAIAVFALCWVILAGTSRASEPAVGTI
jgi:Predicted membrane protein (DUF2142)